MSDKSIGEKAAPPNQGVHRFSILVACLTVVLLLAGALVTSNEAGDSVPDWPLSFGRWLIAENQFVANVRYEYSHRVIAGIVGVATLILALWVWFSERRVWMKRLAVIAFSGVAFQAAIGGVRVLFPEYKALIAVPHALVAQSFFGLIVAIALFTSRGWFENRETRFDDRARSLRALTAATVAAVLTQLVLGAGFRHQAFGIIPHLFGAAVVTGLIIWTSVAVFRRYAGNTYLNRPAGIALVLLIAQLGLGAGAYFARVASAGDPQPTEPMISLTASHLVVGALTLATILVLALRCYQVVEAQSQAPVTDRGEISRARGAAA